MFLTDLPDYIVFKKRRNQALDVIEMQHAHCLEILSEKLQTGAKVLDVGSGSGYLAAVMAEMVGRSGKVIGLEHIPELVERSKKNTAIKVLLYRLELESCVVWMREESVYKNTVLFSFFFHVHFLIYIRMCVCKH